MKYSEKVLYHQIHPIKLLTDWVTSIVSVYFFWEHHIVIGLFIAFVPAVIVSLYLMHFIALEQVKNSSFGRYIHKYMTFQMHGTRLVGFLVMVAGSWNHNSLVIIIGIVLILLVWCRGIYRRW